MNSHPDKYNIASSVLSTLANDPMLGAERDPELARLLDAIFPEFLDSVDDGKAKFKQEDIDLLEELFERFGLSIKVKDNPDNVLLNAYMFCSVYFGKFVNTKMRRADEYEAVTKSWPQEWHDYVDAVLSNDVVAAKVLAQKLQVLSADCDFPEFVQNAWRP